MKLVALVCLCLVTRCGITAAGVNGQGVVKVFAALGSDVILPCSLSTKENIQSELFDWKKDGPTDEREVFMYDAGIHYNNGRSGQSKMFKGRVSHFPDQLEYGNASITIRNTKVTDRGNYTCDFPRLQPRQIFRVELVVGAAPEPSVTIVGPAVDGLLLQCKVRGASPKPHVQWQDSAGNNLTAEEPQVSERGRSYDVILQVTVNKTDRYRCVATQETIYHQIHSEIYVPPIGAAPKPYVTSLEETKDWSRLQCEVHGNPEPHLQWQDSAGNNLTAEEPQVSKSGDHYNIILQVTVTKTDRYRCVAIQETISHQTDAEIDVYISESSTGSVVAAIVATFFVTVGVGVGVLLAVLRAKGCIPLNCNKDEENTRNSPDANSGSSIPLKSTDNN